MARAFRPTPTLTLKLTLKLLAGFVLLMAGPSGQAQTAAAGLIS